jgi:hypothetical protein
MKEFFTNLPIWVYIIAGVILLALVILALISSKVRHYIYNLVCNAEEKITGLKKGATRFLSVMQTVKNRIPKFILAWFSERKLTKLINHEVEKMKKRLE